MAASLREARRKRILERGSDRLALITGQIDSLPSSQSHHLSPSPPVLPQPNLPDTSQDENGVPGTELERCETTKGSTENTHAHVSSTLDPQFHKHETDDATPPPALDINREVEAPLAPSQLNTAVDDEGLSRESRPQRTNFLTVNKLGSSISASENIRFLCAIVIALLVVLSHLPVPLLRNNIIAAVRTAGPVFLVLLTDVTIVLSRLLSWKQVTTEEVKTGLSEGAFSLVEGLGAAIVLYKAINAAFTDYCVYLVVVVCGLSLLRLCI